MSDDGLETNWLEKTGKEVGREVFQKAVGDVLAVTRITHRLLLAVSQMKEEEILGDREKMAVWVKEDLEHKNNNVTQSLDMQTQGGDIHFEGRHKDFYLPFNLSQRVVDTGVKWFMKLGSFWEKGNLRIGVNTAMIQATDRMIDLAIYAEKADEVLTEMGSRNFSQVMAEELFGDGNTIELRPVGVAEGENLTPVNRAMSHIGEQLTSCRSDLKKWFLGEASEIDDFYALRREESRGGHK